MVSQNSLEPSVSQSFHTHFVGYDSNRDTHARHDWNRNPQKMT
jgi:hypothetical protein